MTDTKDFGSFGGVFMFTNPTDEEFTTLWNNEEYIFPPQSSVPLIIPDETLLNIQEIRKRFAYRLAQREFYKGKVYKTMSKQGNGLPPLYDEKILEPMIEACLKPLPIAQVKVKPGKKESERNYRGSKAVANGEDLFRTFEKEIEEVDSQKTGRVMPDKPLE